MPDAPLSSPAIARGPLAAAVVRPDREPAGPDVRLVYADLDLAERDALRRSLGLTAEQAPDDEALVLAAYQTWGPGAADHLGGSFAYAVWDGERRAVVAARDPVGLRPLFWAPVGEAVVVGGDMRAVLDTGLVPDDIDEDMLAGGLLQAIFRPIQYGRTFLKAIRELLGGHVVVVGPDGARAERYWRPEDSPRLAIRDRGEVGEALRALLREVIGESVAGEPPESIGVHLSSGIDSTAVSAFTAEALDGVAPPAFPWQPPPVPGAPPQVEHQRIEALAERWGLPVTYCPRRKKDKFASYLLDSAIDPTTMWAPENPVREAAHAAGVRTLLSGWGGDEAISFSGRSLVTLHMVRHGHVGPLLRMFLHDPLHAIGRTRGVFERASLGRDRTPLDELRQSALRGETPSFARPELLQRARIPGIAEPPRDPRAYMVWLLTRGHIAARTGAWARAGAPYGLQYRYPLVDRRVLAFAIGLPLEVWLTRDKIRRWPLREAGKGLVPDIVRLGDKSEPMWAESGLRAGEGVVSKIAPLVTLDAAGERAEFIDVPRVQTALARREQGNAPDGDDRPAVGALGAAGFLGLGDAHGLLDDVAPTT